MLRVMSEKNITQAAIQYVSIWNAKKSHNQSLGSMYSIKSTEKIEDILGII